MGTVHHTLDSLLAPTSRSTFFSEHWEHAPLVLQRREPAYYDALLGSEHLDYIVSSAWSLQRSSIELMQDGQPVYIGQDEPPAGIYQAYREGRTIRVKGVHRLWPPLWRLCRTLQRDLGFPVRANLYCAPANSAGTRHRDGHDVFIIQVAGRKRWRIAESIPHLPLEYVPCQPPDRAEALFSHRGAALKQASFADATDEPSREVWLEPGDSLYLPRGTAHQVFTEDRPSAHVTVGIYAITFVDLIAVALGQVAQQEIRFRKALPVGSTVGLVPDDAVRDVFQSLLTVLSERADVTTALDEVAGRFVAGMQALGDGALMGSGDPATLSPDAEVQWRPGAAFRLTALNGSVGLASCDATFTAPESFSEPIRFIAERPRFRIKDLPGGLSPRSKVVLVRQLIEKKILRVCAAD